MTSSLGTTEFSLVENTICLDGVQTSSHNIVGTVKPVSNDHLYNNIYYMLFIE